MSIPSTEQLTDPAYASNLESLSLEEIRLRRSQCQDAEESLSLQRRLIQGRLDIVQADLYRRAGGGSESDVSALIEALPEILVERGDRHLGPGRLTSFDDSSLGAGFDQLISELDQIVDGARLTNLADESEASVRAVADQLDQRERSISSQRHKLHRNIDLFQAEIVKRYKNGEASVEGLLGS